MDKSRVGSLATTVRRLDTESLLGWLVSACGLFGPSVMLTVNRADSVILSVLALIGIYAVVRHGFRNFALSTDERRLILVFAMWYAVILLAYFAGDQTDTGFKMIGRSLRIPLMIPAFIACRRYFTHKMWLFAGLLFAAFAALLMALIQSIHTSQLVRASGVAQAITFGDLSISIAFMAVSFWFVWRPKRKQLRYLLAGAAMSCGLIASILSGTRGGWVALPVFLIITALVFSRNSGRRGIKVFVMGSVFVIVALLLAPSTIVLGRTMDALNNLRSYSSYLHLISNGDLNRHGCLNDPLLLGMIRDSTNSVYNTRLTVSVIDDSTALKEAGFLRGCQSGQVIHVVNPSKTSTAALYLPRDTITPSGDQIVEFIMRGQGAISIEQSVDSYKMAFDYSDYKRVQYEQSVKRLAWPYFWLPPGDGVYFTSVQRGSGEYIFPFVTGSIGKRFEMWRAAWHIFKQHPFLGAGTGSFLKEVAELVKERDISPSVVTFDHPHNDYLNALSGQGLIGFAVYLLGLIYPLFLFGRALRADDQYKKAAGFAGVILISGLLVFGFTETMFVHSIVMSTYGIYVAILASIILGKNNDTGHDALLSDDPG